MTKLNFLMALRDRLSALPKAEIEERLNFYSEMIEDRVEEGLSEEKAVAAVGSVDEIAAQVIADSPIANETPKKKWKPWEIVLLVLGSPLWLSLLIAAFAVALSLYVSLWAVLIALWAIFAAFAGCAVGFAVAGVAFICESNVISGVAMIGSSILCAGLAILLFLGCKAATKGILRFTKRCFTKKEAKQ